MTLPRLVEPEKYSAAITSATANRNDLKDCLLSKFEQEFYLQFCPTTEDFLKFFHATACFVELWRFQELKTFQKLQNYLATRIIPHQKLCGSSCKSSADPILCLTQCQRPSPGCAGWIQSIDAGNGSDSVLLQQRHT